MSQLKIKLDIPACCGYGLCAEICPDVYKLDDNGIVYIESDIVPEGMEELAEEGAASCPQLAITLVKEDT